MTDSRSSTGSGDALCFYCGKQTNLFAGNPSEWPLIFCQPDGTGIARHHHAKCVVDRLRGVAQGQSERGVSGRFTPGVPVEIRKVEDAIDEIIIRGGDVHIEQMDDSGWFMGVEASDGGYWQFWFGAKNRKSHVEFRHTEYHHPAVADFTKPAAPQPASIAYAPTTTTVLAEIIDRWNDLKRDEGAFPAGDRRAAMSEHRLWHTIQQAKALLSSMSSTNLSPPVVQAPHNSGERLPNSDVAGAGGETVSSTHHQDAAK